MSQQRWPKEKGGFMQPEVALDFFFDRWSGEVSVSLSLSDVIHQIDILIKKVTNSLWTCVFYL